MRYPAAYIEYLVEYHVTRDWFECHEIMEEYWKEEQELQLKPTWNMLVKIAVAQYHERRANYIGAAKLYRSLLALWPRVSWEILSIDDRNLRHEVERHLSITEHLIDVKNEESIGIPFEAINMIITDPELIRSCQNHCEARNITWQTLQTPVGEEIMHRHRLRDRTDVITARHEALVSKRGGNS